MRSFVMTQMYHGAFRGREKQTLLQVRHAITPSASENGRATRITLGSEPSRDTKLLNHLRQS